MRARDDETPDWAAIGQPVAELLDTVKLQHPRPKPSARPEAAPPKLADIERAIRACGAHLLRSYRNNGFIPAYAAFNLIGDPDMRGREFLMALTGLDARGYKNSTLLFNLARIFIARSPARELINPPWKGIAEPMWQPMQIRHRSAYYDAFYIESLLGFVESGLASAEETVAAKRAIAAMADFCLGASREQVRGIDGNAFDVVTAIAPHPHPRFCASSPGSRRSSALVSTCRTATPRPARSPRQRRRASTIRCSISRCPTSTADIRSRPAPRAQGHGADQRSYRL